MDEGGMRRPEDSQVNPPSITHAVHVHQQLQQQRRMRTDSTAQRSAVQIVCDAGSQRILRIANDLVSGQRASVTGSLGADTRITTNDQCCVAIFSRSKTLLTCSHIRLTMKSHKNSLRQSIKRLEKVKNSSSKLCTRPLFQHFNKTILTPWPTSLNRRSKITPPRRLCDRSRLFVLSWLSANIYLLIGAEFDKIFSLSGSLENGSFDSIIQVIIPTVATYDPIGSNRQRYLFSVSVSVSCLLLYRGCSKVISNYRLETFVKE